MACTTSTRVPLYYVRASAPKPVRSLARQENAKKIIHNSFVADNHSRIVSDQKLSYYPRNLNSKDEISGYCTLIDCPYMFSDREGILNIYNLFHKLVDISYIYHL